MIEIHQRYTQADTDRQGKLTKSRAFSRATINTLLPDSPTENRSNTQARHPHSSLPARGLVEWAGKVVSAIIPIAGIPFLSLDLPPIIKHSASPDDLARLTDIAKVIQDTVHHEIAQSNIREVLTSAMQHIGCVGDVLVYQNDMEFSYFRVDNYIVRRDIKGQPIEIIIRQFMREIELDEAQLAKLRNDNIDVITKGNENYYPYYTELTKDGNRWVEKKYLGNSFEEGSEDSYSEDSFPYYALRYKFDPYEDWSTSLVEENYGDIIASHASRETLLEGMAIGNMGYVGFNPSNITANILKNTKNWGAVPIRDATAIQFIQPNNIAAIQTSASFDSTISQEIRRIFLMDVAAELTHDRVTKYQIQQANSAFERSSGGILSTIKNDLLKPLARNTLNSLVKNKKLPKEFLDAITNGDLEIVIKSGIDAIRSDTEDQAIFQFFLEMVQAAPESIQSFNIPALLKLRAKNLGIPSEIFKTDEDIETEQNNETQAKVTDALIDNVGPAAQGITEGLIKQNV